jgi:hypothetical protein
VQATWRGGRRVDLAAFMSQIQAVEAAGAHPVDHTAVVAAHKC